MARTAGLGTASTPSALEKKARAVSSRAQQVQHRAPLLLAMLLILLNLNRGAAAAATAAASRGRTMRVSALTFQPSWLGGKASTSSYSRRPSDGKRPRCSTEQQQFGLRKRRHEGARRALHSRTALASAGAATVAGGGGEGERHRVVFLGTPDVAAEALQLLFEASDRGEGGGFDICAVVTQPPKPAGRKRKLTPSPVQLLADSREVPVLAPEKAKDEDFLQALRDLEPELCITAAYGQFLPRKFLEIPPLGTLNVHPSLLPLWRGASPVQRSLEAGDSVTGVSVLFTELKMDSGPIVRQTEYKYRGDEKAPEMLSTLFAAGTRDLISALPSVWDGSVSRAEQQHEAATPAAKISPEEAMVDFEGQTALNIHNKVRALAGWPGTWANFSWGGSSEAKKLKLITTAVEPDTGGETPSREVELVGKSLRVVCGDGSCLQVLEVQPPSKKAMDAKSFVNGLKGQVSKDADPETAAAAMKVRWIPNDPPTTAAT